MRHSITRLTALSLLVMACSDGGTRVDGGNGGEEGDEGAEATDALGGCAETVYEGQFEANSDEELEALRGVTEVTEGFLILEGVTNLDAASCLQRVGGVLRIGGTTDLETLDGLERLESAAEVQIIGNAKLKTTAGLGIRDVRSPDTYRPVWSADTVHMSLNSVLTELRFDNLETVGMIILGECSWDEAVYRGNDSLKDLDGFPSLLEGSQFFVRGYAALTSAETFIQKYGGLFRNGVGFQANPSLDAGATRAAWEAAGFPAEKLTMCGNLGDTEDCEQCPAPP